MDVCAVTLSVFVNVSVRCYCKVGEASFFWRNTKLPPSSGAPVYGLFGRGQIVFGMVILSAFRDPPSFYKARGLAFFPKGACPSFSMIRSLLYYQQEDRYDNEQGEDAQQGNDVGQSGIQPEQEIRYFGT